MIINRLSIEHLSILTHIFKVSFASRLHAILLGKDKSFLTILN